MAEFILGGPLTPLARRFPRLRRALWRLDEGFVRLLLAIFRRLPVDSASRLGSRVGGLIGPRLGRKSQLLRENLAIAFPEKSPAERERLLRECWRQSGRILAEYPHLDRIAAETPRFEVDTRLCDPRGLTPCIMVSAHLSNWEVTGVGLARLGIPNVGLYTPPSNPHFDRMLRESRAVMGSELLARDNSARRLVRALKEGSSAAMAVDRRVDEGAMVDFFGQPKASTLMPARLALKQGCALIPTRVQRLRDARFRIIFYPPVEPADPAADERERATDMMQQVHHHFETWIREQPAEWLCSKRLWPRGTNATVSAVQSAGPSRYNKAP